MTSLAPGAAQLGVFGSLLTARQHGRRRLAAATAFMAFVTLWFGARVLVAPLNHDEAQYLAGAALAGGHVIYRDYLSLQPPLQSWVYAPIALILDTHVYFGMRMLSAALAILTLALMLYGQLARGVRLSVAMTTTTLMAACAPFEFAASVVRNDMLPLVLFSGAVLVGIRAIEGRGNLWAPIASGLLLGLAVSSKLTYAPSLLVLVIGMLTLARSNRALRAFWCCIGAGLGLLPCLLAVLQAPLNAYYGLIGFAQTATPDWYSTSARHGQLGFSAKALALGSGMIASPVLAAIAVCWAGLHRRGNSANPAEKLLIGLVMAGLVGAALPTPTQQQYLLPMLPPLFLLLGSVIAAGPPAMVGRLVLAASAITGLLPTLKAGQAAFETGSPIIGAERAARQISMLIDATSPSGPVATVSPHMAVDSGLPLDLRFATGPFVFRSGHLLSDAQARTLHVATPHSLARDFYTKPPAAILVGYEQPGPNARVQIDRKLEEYAIARRFRHYDLIDGVGRLYMPRRPDANQRKLSDRP